LVLWLNKKVAQSGSHIILSIIFVTSKRALLNCNSVLTEKEDCIVTFYKLYHNSGFTENLPFTCSITYEDFRTGFYLCAFDLSTSSQCNSAGQLKLFLFFMFISNNRHIV